MKKIFVTTVLLVVFLLTSCTHTPDNVKSETQSDKNDNAVLEDISNNKDKYIAELKKLKLDNMTFNDDIQLDIPKEVKPGEYICPDKFWEDYENVFSYYDDSYDEKNITEDENTYPTGPAYTNKEKNLEILLGCTGFFSYYKDFDCNIYYNESELVEYYPAAEAINCNSVNNMSDSDKTLSVSSAVKAAQDFADDFCGKFNYPNTFKVSRIGLYKCEEGYFYKADFVTQIEDTNLLGYLPTYDTFNENLICPSAFAYICSDEVNSFTVNSCFKDHDTENPEKETADLCQSAAAVSEALAGKMDLDVKRISFEYVMIKTDSIEKKENNKKTHREKAPWASYCSFDTYKAKPCWVFYFDEAPNKEVYAIFDPEDTSVKFVNNAR